MLTTDHPLYAVPHRFNDWRTLATQRAHVILRNQLEGTLLFVDARRGICKVHVAGLHVWVKADDVAAFQTADGGWIALVPWNVEDFEHVDKLRTRHHGEPATLRQIEEHLARRDRWPNLVTG